jgi:Na+/phosphate symporter
MSKKNSVNVFKKEYDILDRNISVLTDKVMSKEKIFSEFLRLSEQYDKLFKYSIKLTKIGDLNARKLLKRSEQAQEEKEILENKTKVFLDTNFSAGAMDENQAKKLNLITQNISTLIQNFKLFVKTLGEENLSEEQQRVIIRMNSAYSKIIEASKKSLEESASEE